MIGFCPWVMIPREDANPVPRLGRRGFLFREGLRSSYYRPTFALPTPYLGRFIFGFRNEIRR